VLDVRFFRFDFVVLQRNLQTEHSVDAMGSTEVNLVMFGRQTKTILPGSPLPSLKDFIELLLVLYIFR